MVVEYFDPRLYMLMYVGLLKWLGVNLNGTPRYISSSARFDDFNLISIGSHSVVSKGVVFLTHDYSVTTGLRSIGSPPNTDVAFIKPIVIGDNVFIGMNVLLTPGVVIEDNVIVGAGSVLRGRIPKNSIVIGNPSVVVESLDARAVTWQEKIDGSNSRADLK